MAEFANFTYKWRAVPTHQHSNADKVTKRNRQPVACQPCRSRKLKCNKGHPCENCSKRNENDACIYGKSTSDAHATRRKDEARPSTSKAQERLKHLEDLVRVMVDSSYSHAHSNNLELNDSDSDENIVPIHLTRAAADGGSYVGPTHWSTILQHIHEPKNDIGSHSPETEDDVVDNSKPDALFGDHRPPSLEHVLNTYLPPRIQVDRRVSQYFNAKYLIIPFLHSKQFQRQYEKFWEDTANANPLWVSILFSICSLATTLSAWSIAPANRHTRTREGFVVASGQCLVLGNYSKPQPFVVDALSLFLQCKIFSALDPQKEVALVFSIQTRMAYLMGYHRDGANFPTQFTPFETEMRRRSWAMIKQFDLMASFQLGIPSNIIPETWDTKVPSNLLDTDFDEDTKVLPTPRPDNENTHMQYFIIKTRIMDVHAKICHHAISFPSTEPSLSDVMALDAAIRKQADRIPESLRIRPISQSITDQPSEVMVHVNISFLWRKALCVLHRKYVTVIGNDYSYNTCVEAASAMCDTINDLYPEFQSGGIFEKDGWMIHSLTIQDFILAIIVVCLTLSISRKRYLGLAGSVQQWLEQDETRRLLHTLNKAQDACTDLVQHSGSKEVQRVSNAASALLEKLYRSDGDSASSRHMTSNITTDNARGSVTTKQRLKASKETGVDISPLSMSDQPTSVTGTSGIVPPDWIVSDNSHVVPLAATSAQRRVPPVSRAYPGPSFEPVYLAGPTPEQNASTHVALGPFSNIMAGLEMESLNDIDWTSFDQFTSSYGADNEYHTELHTTLNSGLTSHLNPETPDYGDWESTPVYSLGGRARDPVTGKSQQP